MFLGLFVTYRPNVGKWKTIKVSEQTRLNFYAIKTRMIAHCPEMSTYNT